MSASPVKAASLALGLAVSSDLADVAGVGAELGVVVAYGRLIPAAVLRELAMVNVHFSLLPRWRGAAPLERALLAGDVETGVSLMALEEGLDTGPVYATGTVAIGDDDLDTLRRRLVAFGSDLLVDLLAGGVGALGVPTPQVGQPTYAEKLSAEDYRLDWSRPAVELVRVVRLDRAFTSFRGRRLGIVRAVAHPGAPSPEGAAPGTMLDEAVVTGAGTLELEVVHPEGRRPVPFSDWRRGARPADGELLG